MIDLNKVYYLAHPCTTGGESIEENKLSEQHAFKKLKTKFPGIKVIRPLVLIPDGMGHTEAMERCFKFLSGCDGAIFSGHWMISKGCKMEFQYCINNNKDIIDLEYLLNEVAM